MSPNVAALGALNRYNARRLSERKLNRFADLLADGMTAREAAAHMGQSISWGNSQLALIRRKLGWQAR